MAGGLTRCGAWRKSSPSWTRLRSLSNAPQSAYSGPLPAMAKYCSAARLAALLIAVAVSVTEASQAKPLHGNWKITSKSRPVTLELKLDVLPDGKVTGLLDGAPVTGEQWANRISFAPTLVWRGWKDGSIGSEDSEDMYPTVYFIQLKSNDAVSMWSETYIRGTDHSQLMEWTIKSIIRPATAASPHTDGIVMHSRNRDTTWTQEWGPRTRDPGPFRTS